MTASIFDLFSIGVGPSSSHTVGPMRAAATFARHLDKAHGLTGVARVDIHLYGSLAATGHGHGTLTACAIGLEANHPEDVTPNQLESTVQRITSTGELILAGKKLIPFAFKDIVLHPLTVLPRHTNGMRFAALEEGIERPLFEQTYYSIGGGFIICDGDDEGSISTSPTVPYPFASGAELLKVCDARGVSISDVMLDNELVQHDMATITARILEIYQVMQDCVRHSVGREGLLPGALKVRRRAKSWHEKLLLEDTDRDPALASDWVNLVAMAVNEENASGGRVVTAPTNGAAGIIPAVLHYATTYIPAISQAAPLERDQAIMRFFLTAGAIGSLYKERASISGAEVGCQGEVGSAASMAAAGLAELLGGTPRQVENAAEIAMEHHLGLTCDPVGGLVQIPCIERNAIGANKAINAARMALRGDGEHRVSLDQVMETMRQTGHDMSYKYKETSLAGLATNVPIC